MPYLVKKVSGEILESNETSVNLVSILNASIGVEDYINVNTFIGYTQNFSQVVEAISIPKQTSYGLKNNTSFTLLNISY